MEGFVYCVARTVGYVPGERVVAIYTTEAAAEQRAVDLTRARNLPGERDVSYSVLSYHLLRD